MPDPIAALHRRRRRHDALAARLAALDDAALADLVAGVMEWRRGAGGESGVIEVDGEQVFVKKIHLTDLERAPGNEDSTANLFDLPVFYQYGVGSAGFGAWRELSAYRAATAWVTNGECPFFPLLHHWRVLPRTAPPPDPAWDERLQRGVAYWNGSEAIRARLTAIRAATASLTLFLEYAPECLHDWLARQLEGERVAPDFEAQVLRAHAQSLQAAAFMNARGMLHFDLHAHNVMTDGDQLYVGDFGLAICAGFDLSPAERGFFESHRLYDRAFADMAFLKWLEPAEAALPPAASALVELCRPVADLLWSFLTALREDKTLPFPAREIENALAEQAGVGARSPGAA